MEESIEIDPKKELINDLNLEMDFTTFLALFSLFVILYYIFKWNLRNISDYKHQFKREAEQACKEASNDAHDDELTIVDTKDATKESTPRKQSSNQLDESSSNSKPIKENKLKELRQQEEEILKTMTKRKLEIERKENICNWDEQPIRPVGDFNNSRISNPLSFLQQEDEMKSDSRKSDQESTDYDSFDPTTSQRNCRKSTANNTRLTRRSGIPTSTKKTRSNRGRESTTGQSGGQNSRGNSSEPAARYIVHLS